MTRRKPTFSPKPRMGSDYECAVLLNMGENKFRELRPELEAKGFPAKDDLIDSTDMVAANYWLDRRAGLDHTIDADRELDAWRP